MDRIKETFTQASREKRACFIAYVCAGDPAFETSIEICRALIDAGTDILELGVPFSDPLADGLTNQLAAQRALEAGMNSTKVLDLVRRVRTFSQIPIVLYTYYNLVFSQGIKNYVRDAKEAGVDGLLTLDLPPEESDELLEASRTQGLKNIFIVAPTTPAERVKRIADAASGFIYYVSREGVTGVRDSLASNIGEAVTAIKKHTPLPVVVGFGISNADQVRSVGTYADGVVVGSALVNCIAENQQDKSKILETLSSKAETLIRGLQPQS